jgi:hypothetical protein
MPEAACQVRFSKNMGERISPAFRRGAGTAPRSAKPPGGGFFVEGAGARAYRLPFRRIVIFSESLPIPADASGANRPTPPATTYFVPHHP